MDDEQELKVQCPACGSTEIMGLDRILAHSYIQGWRRNDHGELEPVYSGESDVLWDTQGPSDEDMPFFCNNCEAELSPRTLKVTTEKPS